LLAFEAKGNAYFDSSKGNAPKTFEEATAFMMLFLYN
jgi:hypothetical protein